MALTPDQEDAIKFSFGELKYLEGRPSPTEPGPARRGWRFARAISESIGEPIATEPDPMIEERPDEADGEPVGGEDADRLRDD